MAPWGLSSSYANLLGVRDGLSKPKQENKQATTTANPQQQLGRMAQQIKVLTAKPDDLSSSPGNRPMWWNARNDSKLSSDFCTCVNTPAYTRALEHTGRDTYKVVTSGRCFKK